MKKCPKSLSQDIQDIRKNKVPSTHDALDALDASAADDYENHGDEKAYHVVAPYIVAPYIVGIDNGGKKHMKNKKCLQGMARKEHNEMVCENDTVKNGNQNTPDNLNSKDSQNR